MISGTALVHDNPCLRHRDDADAAGSTGAGTYVCTPGGHNGRNSYRLVDGPVVWDLRWESGAEWGAVHLGQLVGLGGAPKWVLHGNGWYRYFSTVDSLEPPASPAQWRARTRDNTDAYHCAEGSIHVAQAHPRRDLFPESFGYCADASGDRHAIESER